MVITGTDPQQLLTVSEVAQRLRLSRDSVYRHVHAGRLPALRVGEAGPLRFEPEAVERLLRPTGSLDT